MKKIAFIGDPHLCIKSPTSRTEVDFWSVCTTKIKWCYQTCKDLGITKLITTGDIIDSRSPSVSMIHKIAALLEESKLYNIDVYTIGGNHDMSIYTDFNLTGLMLLKKLGCIQFIDHETILDGIKVMGIDYGKKLPKAKNKNSILLSHELILPPEESLPIETVNPEDVIKLGYKLIINGHYHKPYIYKNIINPGTVVRTKWDERDFQSKLVVVNEDLTYDLIDIPRTDSSLAFSYRYEMSKGMTFESKLNSFISHLQKLTPKSYDSKFWFENKLKVVDDVDIKNTLGKYYEEIISGGSK